MPMDPTSKQPLEHEHTTEAIQKRIAAQNEHGMLGDFVLGAVDGAITTFAIVTGTAGAGLSAGVALVLGLANVLADGLSMAIGNYLKTRADQQMVGRYRRMEERHIDRVPDGERAEIREIFASKGFSGDVLDSIVETITSDRRRWVEVMLVEEWGLPAQIGSPVRAGTVTFVAFVLAGLVPLLPLMLSGRMGTHQTFLISALATGITFVAIGAVRGYVADQRKLVTIIETTLTGGVAATVSFFVGSLLRQFAV
jgi:VIT1/CCC1 family predicted Fe2+/Mn2+ transporter